MKDKIDEFEIVGLHGTKNLRIPIKDNRLILVGENGTGKSTVVYIFYYILTKQWDKLSNYSFEKVTLSMNNEKITILPHDIHNKSLSSIGEKKVQSKIKAFLNEKNLSPDEVINNNFLYRDLQNDITRFYRESPPTNYLHNVLLSLSSSSLMDDNKKLKEIESFIDNNLECTILFLPTYRRIEQDIENIYPGLSNEFKRFSNDSGFRFKDKKHVELVKFGMQDVQSMIDKTMNRFKENFRSNLENLMGTYLKDILQKKHQDIDIEEIKMINIKLDATLQRIDELILSKEDKDLLRETINQIISEKEVSGDSSVIAHFLSKLIKINENQSDSEKDVREFVRVCNSYLGDRLQMEYDNVKFKIEIKTVDKPLGPNTNRIIKPKDLSSGQKQTVSLFCHLYLSGRDKYFVIIDEPELSLSVPWQKKILPDIVNSDKCNGLLAVTHSPFVFENDLDSYTHSIEEFENDLL